MELPHPPVSRLVGSFSNFDVLIEESPNAIAVFDRDMRYRMVNQRWLDDYGLRGKELLGHSHYDIFPDIPEQWKMLHRRALAGESLTNDQDRLQRADGSTQYLHWKIFPWYAEGDPTPAGIAMITTDITSSVANILHRETNAANEARRSQRFTHMLSALSQRLAQAATEDELLAAAASYAEEHGARSITLTYFDGLDAENLPLTSVLVASRRDGQPWLDNPLQGVCLPNSQFPLATVVFAAPTGTTFIDVTTITDEAVMAVMRQLGAVTSAIVPLYDQSLKRWLGVLVCHWDQAHTFDFEETTVFNEIARLASVVVGNRRAYLAEVAATADSQRARAISDTLSEINQRLAQATTEDELLAAVSRFAEVRGADRQIDKASLTSLSYFNYNAVGELTQIEIVAIRMSGQAAPLSLLPATTYTRAEYPILELIVGKPNQIQFYEDIETDPRLNYGAARQTMQAFNIRSLIILPLKTGDTWEGMFTFSWQEPQPFTENLRQTFEALLTTMSAVVSRRRALLNSEATKTGSELLYRTTERLNQAKSRQEVLNAASDYARQHGATSAWMYYFDNDDRGQPQWAESAAFWDSHGLDFPLQRVYLPDFPFTKLLLASPDKPMLVEDVTKSDVIDRDSKALLAQQGKQALVILPLFAQGQWDGTLTFAWDAPHAFGQVDARIYAALAQALRPVVQARRLTENLEKTVEQRTRDLRESNQKFDIAIEGAELGLWDWNLITNDVFYSDRWCNMLGYDITEVQPTFDGFGSLVHPEDGPRVMEKVNAYLKGEIATYQVEMRMKAKNGRWKWVLSSGKVGARDAEGKITRLVGVHQDLTERKEAEQQVREQRQFLQFVLDNIPARVFWKDTNLTYLGCNQAFARDAGLRSPADLIGKTDYVMGWAEQADLYRADDRKVMDSGEARLNFEEPQTTPDGSRIWLQTSKVPLRSTDGTLVGILGTYQDVTERKEAEQERARLYRQLRETSRYKDEFFAVMSHELRTPLNAMIGLLGISLMKGKLSPEDTNLVTRARANSDRLLSLINNILDISRMEAGRLQLTPSYLNVRKMLDKVRGTVDVLADQKYLHLTVNVDPNMPEIVRTDEDALIKIVTNLLGNAVKFTENGAVAVNVRQIAPNFEIEVKDTGIGIPAHMHEVIFETFRQADASSTRKHGGSGLGLSIVRSLCQAMGGTIRIESEVGRGSTFTVTLPLQLEKAVEGTKVQS